MSHDKATKDFAKFRPLTQQETEILRVLLGTQFPGQPELIEQLAYVSAHQIDSDGSLEFGPIDGPRARVVRRIPVEAEEEDQDGVTIHVLLHVLDGLMRELEVYREDSAPVISLEPRRLRVMVL